MKFLFIICVCFFSVISHAAPRLEVPVEIGGTTFRLEKFNDDFINQTFWGEYVTSSVTKQEFHFHFFPDKKFLVTATCDLCTEVPIAEGVFRFSTGRIWLSYKARKGRDLPDSPLFALHGYDTPGVGVERKYEIILLDEKNYARTLAGNAEFEYMRRTVAYVDWKRVYSRLKKNGKSHGALVTPNGYPVLTPPKTMDDPVP